MESTLVSQPQKSSAEILSELFSAFNAKPPNLDIEDKDKSHKKHKKSKKKHKHKDKKYKRKSKHRQHIKDSSSSGSDTNISSKHKKRKSKKKNKGELDLDTIFKSTVLVKQEKDVDSDVGKLQIKKENETNGHILPVKINTSPEEIKIKEESSISKKKEEKDQNDKILTGCTENEDKFIDKVNKKITIQNLKDSIAYKKAVEEVEEKSKFLKSEDGEIIDSESDTKSDEILNDRILDEPFKKSSKIVCDKNGRKRRHSDRDKYSSEKRSKHEHKTEKRKREDDERHRHRSYCSASRERHRHKREENRDVTRSHRLYKCHERIEHKRHRSRSREYRRRSRSPSSSKPVHGIDKKKLLEIARRNAINMLKSGTLPDALTLGPHAQEKVIAAIKAGGKTIEELTDFCKNLSKKEALGELSSVSSAEEDDLDGNLDRVSVDKVFHHPFQLKDKPSSIVMNIKNATPLPIKTSKEKNAELRLQFPVSSGQLHRKTENEWVPVEPQATVSTSTAVAIIPPAVLALSTPAVTVAPTIPEVDISAIVSQRLSAIRRLQENPNDIHALTQMQRVQKDMENWAQSKQQPGQFVGSTGANILSAAELSSGYQAWARKDQLTNAAPVSGGMGMHLLQKMGWRPGEGLGKEKSGTLEPLLLEVKLDKRGLVAGSEAGASTKKTPRNNAVSVNSRSLTSKHPVSLLGEYASKRKLGVPQYQVCFECGPDHKKNFLFKVLLNGMEYKPNVASTTKKQAKADAALVCLQHLGVLPT